MGNDRLQLPVVDLTNDTDEEDWYPEHLESENLKKCIEEEAKLMIKIFPKLQFDAVKGMLTKVGNVPKRPKAVLRQLSAQHNIIKKELSIFPQNAGCSSNVEPIFVTGDDNKVPQRLDCETMVLNIGEKLALLGEVLPDADPFYLKMQLVRIGNNPQELNLFVTNAMENHDYPIINCSSMTLESSNRKNTSKFQLENTKPVKRAKQTIALGDCSSFINNLKKNIPNSLQERSAAQAKKKKRNNSDKINLDDLFNWSKKKFQAPNHYNSGSFAEKTNFSNLSSNYSNCLVKRADSSADVPRFENNQDRGETKKLPTEDPALYTTKFRVKTFLASIPDPETYFRENRHMKPWSKQCEHYAVCALFNLYNKIDFDKIKECIFIAPNFLAACDMLDEVPQPDDKSRSHLPMPHLVDDIPLLKEIAYKTHHDEIMQFITTQQEVFNSKIAEAKLNGSIRKCDYCHDEEVLPEDAFKCEGNCCFCRDCVRTRMEIMVPSSNDQITFHCLNNCRAQFSLNTLQRALPEQLFSKITSNKKLDNLEYCPFCGFGTVSKTDGKIFYCSSPNCRKQSCRICRAPSHVPAPCEEVEQDENVKARTYIENKMSEAVIRECHECKMRFVKSVGCNTIMCPCGAQICYICRKPVTDLYLHRTCQKYNVTKLDEERVIKAAEEAKKEVFSILKIDPTVGIKRHFDELRKINLQLKIQDESISFPENFSASIFQRPSKLKNVATASTSSNSSGSQWLLKQPTIL